MVNEVSTNASVELNPRDQNVRIRCVRRRKRRSIRAKPDQESCLDYRTNRQDDDDGRGRFAADEL